MYIREWRSIVLIWALHILVNCRLVIKTLDFQGQLVRLYIIHDLGLETVCFRRFCSLGQRPWYVDAFNVHRPSLYRL